MITVKKHGKDIQKCLDLLVTSNYAYEFPFSILKQVKLGFVFYYFFLNLCRVPFDKELLIAQINGEADRIKEVCSMILRPATHVEVKNAARVLLSKVVHILG